MQLLVNLHVTLCNFKPLLIKFKYFIKALINAENYFCGITLESSSVFSKSEENFNPKQFTNIMFADDNLTESFTADVPMGIFQNV